MNKKTLVTIIISIVAGIVAVLLVNAYIQKKEKSIFKGMNLIEVVAVTRDLPAGTMLSMDLLAKRKVPEKYVHGNAVTPEDAELVIGQMMNFPLKTGDPVLWTDLQDEGQQAGKGLAATVTKGERAFSIAVDRVSGVSGLLKANDHIDLLCTVRSEETGEEATLTLVQNITVLATGGMLSGDRSNDARKSYSTLTLLVTLEEAELIVFAESKGKLMALLRNPEDIETHKDIPKVTFQNIMKSEYRKEIQVKRDRIEVIKKGKVQR